MNVRTEMRGPAKDLMRTFGTIDGVLKMFRNPSGGADARAHLIFRADDGRLVRFTLGDPAKVAALAACLFDVVLWNVGARERRTFKRMLEHLKLRAGAALEKPEEDET